MKATTTPDYPRGLTFEQVWASIKELRESQKETARTMKESSQETERYLKEMIEKSSQEKDRYLKEMLEKSSTQFDKKLSKLGNRLGEIVEAMVNPNLKSKFNTCGFNFTEFSRDKEISANGRFIAEIDVLLESRDNVMVVEIKSKPSTTDIKEHLERMKKLRLYVNDKGDMRKYYGAIGGMIFGENERNLAFKNGFYVIEPSGDSFNVIAPEGKNKPRVW